MGERARNTWPRGVALVEVGKNRATSRRAYCAQRSSLQDNSTASPRQRPRLPTLQLAMPCSPLAPSRPGPPWPATSWQAARHSAAEGLARTRALLRAATSLISSCSCVSPSAMASAVRSLLAGTLPAARPRPRPVPRPRPPPRCGLGSAAPPASASSSSSAAASGAAEEAPSLAPRRGRAAVTGWAAAAEDRRPRPAGAAAGRQPAGSRQGLAVALLC